jgi:predicted dienelactone hydrolase
MPLALLRPLVALACLATAIVHAAGFDTLEIPASAEGPALRTAVWTPCAKPAAEFPLGPYVLRGVRKCPTALPPASQTLPLVVISHGYGGSALGHHATAEALANAGFVVAAINHPGDDHEMRGRPADSIVALATRTADIRRLVDHMLRKWPGHAALDERQVGFFGFSRGGYTGLVLIGAQPDFSRLLSLAPSQCASASEAPACTALRQRYDELLATPLVRDARIKAAVIADPLSMVFDAAGLKKVKTPVQLWASEYGGDGVTPESVVAVRRNLPVMPDWHRADKAGHFGFLAPCTPALLASAPEICRDGPGFDRGAFHLTFNAEVVAFFQRHLGTPGAALSR